jgi:small GTP-binding protein
MSYDYIFKILIIGSLATGKTAITERFTRNRFNCVHNSTIGVDFSSVLTTVNNTDRIKIHLWDTAGNKSFGPIINSYYRGVAGTVIVFDISNRKSYDAINYWYNQIEEHSDNDNMSILLIGNKSDISSNRVVSYEEASLLAKTLNMIYYETSAKNNENIYESFHSLIKDIYNKININDLGPGVRRHFSKDIEVLIKKEKKNVSSCCCIC